MLGFLKNIFQDKITLAKIDILNSLSLKGSELVYLFMMLFLSIFFFTFLNCGILFYLISVLKSAMYGFFIIAGFYLILILILMIFRIKIKLFIQNKVIALFSPKLFPEMEENNVNNNLN